MADVQTSIGDGFNVHVTYMDPPPPASGAIVVSVSNPDIATVEEDPQHPGDSTYVIIMPAKLGTYVVGADDGFMRGWLPEFESVESGMAQPLPIQQIVLG